MKELLRQKTYQGALSKVNSPLDPSFKLRQLKYVTIFYSHYSHKLKKSQSFVMYL